MFTIIMIYSLCFQFGTIPKHLVIIDIIKMKQKLMLKLIIIIIKKFGGLLRYPDGLVY